MNWSPYGKNLLAVFPYEWAKQIVVVFSLLRVFPFEQRSAFPTIVRVFCDTMTAGVAPNDFFPQWIHEIRIYPEFGMELLRAFDEKYAIPNAVVVDVNAGICEYDSFLTAVTRVEIREMHECSITLPTTVVRFNASHVRTRDDLVSGTENLTSHSSETKGRCLRVSEAA